MELQITAKTAARVAVLQLLLQVARLAPLVREQLTKALMEV
jgi:hypothetical protein